MMVLDELTHLLMGALIALLVNPAAAPPTIVLLIVGAILPDVSTAPLEAYLSWKRIEKTQANFAKFLGNRWARRSYFLSHSFAFWLIVVVPLEIVIEPHGWLVRLPILDVFVGPVSLGILTHLLYDLPTHKGDPWRMRPFYGLHTWAIPANWGIANVYFRKDIQRASWLFHGTLLAAAVLLR
jgi:hypothetical protein